MMVGDVVDVFDGDEDRWVRCTCEHIGLGLRTFRPLEGLLYGDSQLPIVYGLPWPAGEPRTRLP